MVIHEDPWETGLGPWDRLSVERREVKLFLPLSLIPSALGSSQPLRIQGKPISWCPHSCWGRHPHPGGLPLSLFLQRLALPLHSPAPGPHHPLPGSLLLQLEPPGSRPLMVVSTGKLA